MQPRGDKVQVSIPGRGARGASSPNTPNGRFAKGRVTSLDVKQKGPTTTAKREKTRPTADPIHSDKKKNKNKNEKETKKKKKKKEKEEEKVKRTTPVNFQT